MRHGLGLRRAVYKQVRRLTGARRRCGRVCHSPVADVVRQVLADEQVVGVVDELIGLAIGERARVDDLELTDHAVQGPVRVAEGVLDPVLGETLNLEISEVGIGEKYAVRLDVLCLVRHQQAPGIVEIPGRRNAYAAIRGLVEVLFDQRAVVGLQERDAAEVRARLEAGSQRADRHAVVAHRAGRAEPRALRGIARAGNVVDVAALLIVVGDAAQCEGLGDGDVDHGFDIRVHVAFGDRTGAHLDAAVHVALVRLVRDQPDIAGLRTRPEQCPLRAREDFDALQVGGIDVEVAPRLRQRLLVQVERDIGREARDTGYRQVRRCRSNAADVHRVLAGTTATSGHAGQFKHVIGEIGDTHLLERRFRQGRHRNGHILQRFLALGCRDRDFLDGTLSMSCRCAQGNGHGRCERARSWRRVFDLHAFPRNR